MQHGERAASLSIPLLSNSLKHAREARREVDLDAGDAYLGEQVCIRKRERQPHVLALPRVGPSSGAFARSAPWS